MPLARRSGAGLEGVRLRLTAWPFRKEYDVTATLEAEGGRSFVTIGRTVINNFTFAGSTKDAMQQAVRDALIAFMAATAQAAGRGHQGCPEGRYRACQ
jgi:hypothetical protein